MAKRKGIRTPNRLPDNEIKKHTPMTYKETFYCGNCKNQFEYKIIKGSDIRYDKGGIVYVKDSNDDFKPIECSKCGSINVYMKDDLPF